MAYKQKKSMIAGTDPVKKAKEVLKEYRDAFMKGYNHGGTAENKVSKAIKKGYDSVNKTKQVAKKRATTLGSTEGLSGGVAKKIKEKAAPTKKLDDPSSGDQSHTVEKVGETEAEKKARLKREKKAERKESRKDWRKRTAGRIKDEAISAGTEVLKGAAINALTPKEKKIVNPAAGFNVQFGR